MASRKTEFRAFSNPTIHAFIASYEQTIRDAVHKLPDDELFGPGDTRLDVTTVEQLAYDAQLNTMIAEQLAFHPPLVEVDKASKRFVATNTLAGTVSSTYSVTPKQLIEYRMPVRGEVELLEIMPTSTVGASRIPEIHVIRDGVDGEIALYIQDFGGNTQQVADEAKLMLESLRENSQRLYQDLVNYLKGNVIGEVGAAVAQERRRRQAERQRQADLLSRLP